MRFQEKLIKLKVTGPCVGHNRFLNLRNIDRLVKNETYATFGIKNLGELHPSEILISISKITGCHSDINIIEGAGHIEPKATVKGMREAAKLLSELKKDSKVLLATGHPGSLVGFYLELSRFLRSRCFLLVPEKEVEVKRYKCPDCGTHDEVNFIDTIENVCFVSDGDMALHVHTPGPMAKLIEVVGKPDLVFADHGFAGEAINQDIPLITFMDTNDPVLAIAKDKGHNITIIPMDDNRGNTISAKVAKLLIDLIKQHN